MSALLPKVPVKASLTRDVLWISGADLEKEDPGGWTAMHYAAAYGNADVVDHLLRCVRANSLFGHRSMNLPPGKP